jgi:hypothetical protein
MESTQKRLIKYRGLPPEAALACIKLSLCSGIYSEPAVIRHDSELVDIIHACDESETEIILINRMYPALLY